MRKHKKIFYVSGIISLLFIAPLFWYFTKPTLEKLNLRVIDFGLPYKLKKNEKENDFPLVRIPLKKWNYKPVNINPNFDRKDENYYISLIQEIKKENKDKSGLKFKFSDKNTYKDVVCLINIMHKTKMDEYGFDTEKENSLYVLYRKQNSEVNLFANDTVAAFVDNEKDNNTWINKLNKFYNNSPKESYYLIFGFLILIYSSILKPKLTLII